MLDQKPKTLTMFLLDGYPTGVKKVQLSNWSGLAFIVPRSRLEVVNHREEFSKQCLYFLISGNASASEVYIGEAENFQKRINGHRDKDFWNLCVVFLAKDENLSKAHVKFLEAEFISDCKKANRAKLHNANEPDGSKLAEEDRHEMLDFKSYIKIVLSALGFTFHEGLSEKNEESKNRYNIFTKGVKASGIYSSEGFILLFGSHIVKEEVPSVPFTLHAARAEKLEEGVIVDKGEYYEVARNITFSSVSMAAGFVMGRAANGWTEWKNAEGKTLDQVERKSTP